MFFFFYQDDNQSMIAPREIFMDVSLFKSLDTKQKSFLFF